ncbi:hypothetical protein QTG54_004244, partial [Skeletonema marinoi]
EQLKTTNSLPSILTFLTTQQNQRSGITFILQRNMISSKTLFTSVLIFMSAAVYVSAFQVQPASTRYQTSIAASNDDNSAQMSRRNMLKDAAFTMSALLGGSTLASQPAEATYTGYTQREQDWEDRQKKGEIKSQAHHLSAHNFVKLHQ